MIANYKLAKREGQARFKGTATPAKLHAPRLSGDFVDTRVKLYDANGGLKKVLTVDQFFRQRGRPLDTLPRRLRRRRHGLAE